MIYRFIVLTNNPLVPEKLGPDVPVEYQDVSYEDLLRAARDRIHRGAKLLSHPLSGSVKPGETPFKSVLLSDTAGALEEQSLYLIENALQTCAKFRPITRDYPEKVLKDFQLIDWTLLEGALSSIED